MEWVFQQIVGSVVGAIYWKVARRNHDMDLLYAWWEDTKNKVSADRKKLSGRKNKPNGDNG